MRFLICILMFTFISSTNVYATNIEDDATEVTVPDYGDDLDDPFGGDDFDPFEEETTTQEESSSSSDIVNFIKNGFGLLGDNGVITLMQDAFSYVPSFIWSIIGVGVALMVLIGVAKYVF